MKLSQLEKMVKKMKAVAADRKLGDPEVLFYTETLQDLHRTTNADTKPFPCFSVPVTEAEHPAHHFLTHGSGEFHLPVEYVER